MRQYEPSQIRNVAVVGHGGAGKTMLVEALRYASGATTRLGRIEDGTTTTDFEPEEHERGHSIALGVTPVEWEGHKINLIDCPGYPDFMGEVTSALRVADACLVVVSAPDGVQVQTELIWGTAQELDLPCLFIVNKMDRERASHTRVLAELQDHFGTKPFPLHVPIGEDHDFSGIVDLLHLKAFAYDGEAPKGSSEEIPSEVQAQVDEQRSRLVEAAAEGDDALLEKYLDVGDLDGEEVAKGISTAVASGATAPVLLSSATQLIGIDLLAETICSLVPSPLDRAELTGVSAPGADDEVTRRPSPDEPVCGFVFKTLADPFVGKVSLFRVLSGSLHPDTTVRNTTRSGDERIGQLFHMVGKDHENAPQIVCGDIGATAKLDDTHTGDTLAAPEAPIVLPPIDFPDAAYQVAVAPVSHGEEEKLAAAMQRLHEEDPVLQMERNPETHQTVLSALGEAHLHAAFDRLKRKFGVEVEQLALRIPYRETIRGTAQHETRYIKQSGGRGQYAVVQLEVEPLPEGRGYEFTDTIKGGAIPQNFIPAIDKGVQGAIQEGMLAGYPVVDVKVNVSDGKFHSVDSSDMAFQIAGSMGFKEACRKAQPTLLEPVMDVHIRVPDSLLGDMMGDVNSRRGRIIGTEPSTPGWMGVHAQVPHSEMTRYAIDLRSMTGGRGSFSMSFSHYEDVPQHLQEKVVAESANPDEEVAAKH